MDPHTRVERTNKRRSHRHQDLGETRTQHNGSGSTVHKSHCNKILDDSYRNDPKHNHHSLHRSVDRNNKHGPQEHPREEAVVVQQLPITNVLDDT
jgi:hypothetical protein